MSIYQQKTQHYKYLGHLLQQHYSLQTFLTSIAGGFFSVMFPKARDPAPRKVNPVQMRKNGAAGEGTVLYEFFLLPHPLPFSLLTSYFKNHERDTPKATTW